MFCSRSTIDIVVGEGGRRKKKMVFLLTSIITLGSKFIYLGKKEPLMKKMRSPWKFCNFLKSINLVLGNFLKINQFSPWQLNQSIWSLLA